MGVIWVVDWAEYLEKAVPLTVTAGVGRKPPFSIANAHDDHYGPLMDFSDHLVRL